MTPQSWPVTATVRPLPRNGWQFTLTNSDGTSAHQPVGASTLTRAQEKVESYLYGRGFEPAGPWKAAPDGSEMSCSLRPTLG